MFEQVKQLFTSTISTLQAKFLQKETISISDLATFIQLHPDTVVETKDLLGFTFTFYTLNAQNIHLYLEKKDEKILEISVTMDQEKGFQYRSYEDKYKVSDTIKIPAAIIGS